MNTRLILIIIGGLVGFALLLLVIAIACSPKQKTTQTGNQEVTLTYWRVFDDKDKIQPLIDEYRKDHPKVNVQYRKLTYGEYEKALVDAIADGKGPDMFSVQNTWMPKFTNKIAPLPADQYSTTDYQADFYPAVKDTIKDNRIYAIPISMDALALYANTSLLSNGEIGEPPKTWDDLVGKPGDKSKPGMLAKLNNRQGDTFNQSAIALGNSRAARPADVLSLMMLQQRTRMTNDDHTQATFNLTQQVEGKEEHQGTRALDFYTSFANPSTAFYSWNAQAGDGVTAFAQGRAAMMIGYAYHAPTIGRLNPDLNYTIAPVPQIAGTDPVNYASYWAETVSKNSTHQKEAWAFIRYLTDKTAMTTYTDATKTVPARKGVSAGGNLDAIQRELETAVTWYQGDAQKADEIFIAMINQVLGGETPQRAIDNGANRLTTILRNLKSGGQ